MESSNDTQPRNIVICCDGTGNEYGENNTNVVLLHSLLEKDSRQLAFYDPGVGTGGWEYEHGKITKKCDLATGGGLQKNVEDAYRYLMHPYREGDKVYLFGFSRGAFTARSLAGMLHKVGLLTPGRENMVKYASKMYNTKNNKELSADFKKDFSRSCPVYFIGVWDTVRSLYLNAGKRFHDDTLNPDVKYGCHALAIDEKRKDFPPSLWDESSRTPEQTIEQVWFPGVHSDVGGWYDARGLSNGALHWMAKKAKRRGLRLSLDLKELKRDYSPDAHDELHDSYEGIYRLRGTSVRKIPEGAKLHRSVEERMSREENDYRPKNLPENRSWVND